MMLSKGLVCHRLLQMETGTHRHTHPCGHRNQPSAGGLAALAALITPRLPLDSRGEPEQGHSPGRTSSWPRHGKCIKCPEQGKMYNMLHAVQKI